MTIESSQRWLVLIPLVVLAAVVGLLVLVELQVLSLQRTVDSLVVEQADEDTIAPVVTGESETLVAVEPADGVITPGMNMATYTNEALGYELAMPPTTTARHSQDDVIFDGPLKFEVRRSEWSGTDINEFIYLDTESKDSIDMYGYEVAVAISETGYCDGPGCGDPFVAFSYLKDGYVFTLVFKGDAELGRGNINSLIISESDVLNSFVFLD